MRDITFTAREAPVSQAGEGFSPIHICEIEIGQALPDIVAFNERTGQSYQRAQCLVRLHAQPLGLLEFSLETWGGRAVNYAGYIWEMLSEQINAHLREDGLAEVTRLDPTGLDHMQTPKCVQERSAFLQTAPFASVVLATRDRPDRLARCLPALLAMEYPNYEIIVVDNASSTSATSDFVRGAYLNEPRIRYVREDQPGLSAARNCGVAEAKGEIIAFTDDDVVVDTYWLAALARGFKAAERVVCVTSLLLPLELETATQQQFEEFGGFNKGYRQLIFDRNSGGKVAPLYPFTAGGFGAGAGMAFSAKFLRAKKFDQALGAGSRTGGGEDLAAFFRAVITGNRLVYEPASLAYHEHRSDYASLQKQMYYYGAGLTAYLTKIILDNPFLLFRIMVRIPYGLFFILSTKSPKNQKKSASFPKELSRLEQKGMRQGPFLYIQGRSGRR